MSSSQPISEKAVSGIKVSWEIKLMLIALVFAVIKGLAPFSESAVFLLFARLFFLGGHAFYGYIYFYTNYRITKSTSRSAEEKAAAKDDCQKVIRSVLIRAVLLGLVHMRTGMVPPMFVTVITAFLSMIENDFFYQVLYAKAPELFDVCFT